MACRNHMTDYRITISATKGEQLVVERQYQASTDNWLTVGKYLTANINTLPKNHQPWMEEVPALFSGNVERCLICGFPLAEDIFSVVNGGCIPGNCSYRPPEGTDEYRRIKARRLELHIQSLIARKGDIEKLIEETKATPIELEEYQQITELLNSPMLIGIDPASTMGDR